MTDLAITNALVFDGVSAELAEGDVHVVDGVITDSPGAGAPTVDARGRTVVPG